MRKRSFRKSKASILIREFYPIIPTVLKAIKKATFWPPLMSLENLVKLLFEGFGNLESDGVGSWDFDLGLVGWVGSLAGSAGLL